MQIKPSAGTSGVSHGMVQPSSSHHMHSSVPLNLTLKSVMQSVTRPSPSTAAQASSSGVQSSDIHSNSAVAGSSNGQQHSLFRNPQNVHILPPTHSAIRNLLFYQMSSVNKNSHCNSASYNANGALQSKQ